VGGIVLEMRTKLPRNSGWDIAVFLATKASRLKEKSRQQKLTADN
jgi:hypothetical protein